MSRLEERVLEFINLDISAEYDAANRVVKKHTAALEYIKQEMKKKNITSLSVKDGRISKKLAFSIRKQSRVDVKALPMDIRDSYQTLMEIWTRNVTMEDPAADDVIVIED
ncbi:hypothetical protein DFS34DRAFT_650591 [Phlyctochytrium arcticum]|nr:hypothetical protein DFS34DRAFT_594397 [Phlyctochytrium arcticum]KAI9096493.1 hypothetical protein DFS34DRAFT_650591 [Phlyctochytrium arcticum]